MNVVFFVLVLLAFVVTAVRQLGWTPPAPDAASPMDALGAAMIDAAAGAVTLAIGLVGVMALFLGLMKVAEAGGMLTIIAKTIRPLMVRAFPDVPPNHPAMGAMILNMSANALGLGNAATPFGIRAMQELDTLNRHKGTATNAMVLFLAINTSSVTLLPTGVIALLVLKYLQLKATFSWSLSNLVALLRMNLFVYRDLWKWLNDPFTAPPPAVAAAQVPLPLR